MLTDHTTWSGHDVCLGRPGDEAWAATFEALPKDVYYCPDYVRFTAWYEGGVGGALVVPGVALVPLVIRSLPEGLGREWCDASTPYGYGGPVVASGTTTPEAHDLIAAIVAAARDAGLVSLFLRLHPFIGPPIEAFGGLGQIVHHGQAVWVDLAQPAEQRSRELRKQTRQSIRKLREEGFRVVADEWNRYGDFVRIYQATMDRVGADCRYRHPPDYFDGLRSVLQDRLHLLAVVDRHGVTAAAATYLADGPVVQGHLNGTAPEFLEHGPARLLLHEAAEFFAARGHQVLNHGGGVGGAEDALFQFKAGFSRRRADFVTCRVILDEERYAWATRRASQLGRVGEDDGFFPAYRSGATGRW